MKSLKWLLILSLFMVPLGGILTKTASAEKSASAQEELADRLQLELDSKKMVLNGVNYESAQPLTIKDGSTFVSFSGIAARYGYKVSYDTKTKESVAINESLPIDKQEIRFKVDSLIIKQGATNINAPVAPFALNGSLMIPLRSWVIATDSTINVTGKKISLKWNVRIPGPVADFTVSPEKIYAGETVVTYTDLSKSPTGLMLVNEQWEGRMDIFPSPGQYTITRQVQDEDGIWSAPYSVTIEVLQPNLPPVADFKTDKDQYRIGEPIEYTDLSTDDENAIVRTTWTPAMKNINVFFEPGEKLITLEVEDKHGLKGSITKTITVTDEVLYTKEEYDKLFREVGDKFDIDGGAVLSLPSHNYKIQSDNAQFIRSNSPETMVTEGIAYEDQLTGSIRFLFHNFNNIGYPVKMYLIVTNKNKTTANVNTTSFGIGGPDLYVDNTSKLSTVRYLKSLSEKPEPKWYALKPGESINLMPDLSKFPIKSKQVISAYGDVFADQELNFQVVVVAEGKDPIKTLPSLNIMDRDQHVRGTYNGANREIIIDQQLGSTGDMIRIADPKVDSYLIGYDAISGQNEVNLGNFGVVYKMKLNHVAPNTLIALNPRGGTYTGAFLVNGELVTMTKDSILKTNAEAGVLYRTGDKEESVELVFTLATGSNTPIALLFLPMPDKKY